MCKQTKQFTSRGFRTICMRNKCSKKMLFKNTKTATPTEEMLINKVMECAEMDRLTYRLKEKEENIFFKSWNLFYNWLNKRKDVEG